MLQLRHARQHPTIRQSNTLAALAELNRAGLLAKEQGTLLTDSYRKLRRIEARLRLMSTTARDELPDEGGELDKLARALDYADGAALWDDCCQLTRQNRQLFEQLLGEAGR